jgi:YesN/AraC family two-component response regulator
LTLLHNDVADVLITDLKMPRLNGIEVIEALRLGGGG